MSDLAKAIGYADCVSLLSHVYQRSGFSDPLYVEVYVTVHDYEFLLDILGVLMIRICSMILCRRNILLLEIETTER